jgi:hypothetical protein
LFGEIVLKIQGCPAGEYERVPGSLKVRNDSPGDNGIYDWTRDEGDPKDNHLRVNFPVPLGRKAESQIGSVVTHRGREGSNHHKWWTCTELNTFTFTSDEKRPDKHRVRKKSTYKLVRALPYPDPVGFSAYDCRDDIQLAGRRKAQGHPFIGRLGKLNLTHHDSLCFI